MQLRLSLNTVWSRRIARLTDRLARGRDGSAAVEFAMIAFPFLALIMGLLEIAMIYLVSTTLENATSDAARQIRTGQFQTNNVATTPANMPAAFVTQICSELTWLGSSNCSNNLYVDVRTFTSFSGMSQPDPTSNGQISQANLQFNAGAAGDIVLVRAFYKWALFTPGLDGMAATLNGGSTLISATAAFKNEPYGTAS